MTSAAEVMMTDEERAAVGTPDLNRPKSPNPAATAGAATVTPGVDAATTPLQTNNAGAPPPSTTLDGARTDSSIVKHDGSGAATPTSTGGAGGAGGKDKKGRSKLSPEQRKKLEEMDLQRKKVMEERIKTLTEKLKERIRPFITAKNPGDTSDPEVKAWLAKIKTEAEDLKLESFGVELLHTIGNVYLMKANSALKSRKMFGIPGFVSRLKEKGTVAKEAWGVLGSAIGVQHVMEDMARLQEKGEAAEAELRALEMDLTGKILLASWRGTRWEVSQVLREVCDKVLEEPDTPKEQLFLRARALLLIGELLKEVKPDESDEERRELERLVAEASKKKSAPAKPPASPSALHPTSEGQKKGWKWSVVARNYFRNFRKPPLSRQRLFRGNVDILMLNLIIADILMSFGAISDIRWAYDRQVYCGSFCNAQGVIQTVGETAASLSTLAVAAYTFLAVKAGRPLTRRPWLCLAGVVIIWLWCLLWPIILLEKYDQPGLGEKGNVEYAFTPTPWWCWINDKYMAERIVAEYLWLWIAGICSIGLYVPAYFIVRDRENGEPVRSGQVDANADEQSIAGTIDEKKEARKMLWYPLAYTLCVLPLSLIRWAAFADHSLLYRPQVMPASMTFSSIFNLMGLINVLLIFWTRPAILLIRSDDTPPPTNPRNSFGQDSVMADMRSFPGRDSDSTSRRHAGNGFGGENVSLKREE
ncbi:hypothetical protein FRC11_010228 [Ceratobasidium sp. 423]|nr:hypothetical protein FRC11_010228 [Ceratobasidium sp. 423]